MDIISYISEYELSEIIQRALKEDLQDEGDVTCQLILPEDAQLKACMVSRHMAVLAGTAVAEMVFKTMNPDLAVHVEKADGDALEAGDVILSVEGAARDILSAERTALNFIQRMSGIATMTAQYVERAKPYGVAILDTRKTTPTLRALEKYAVKCGGGENHRMGLYDRIMMKDNHLAYASRHHLAQLIRESREAKPDLQIEIEVDTFSEFEEVVQAKPDWILLDNMDDETMKKCVASNKGRAKLEASGGITLERISAIAQTGVDAISVGALTHSVPAADIALDIR